MSYPGRAAQIAREVQELLSEEDIELLREDAEALGVDGWIAWHDENESEVLAFFGATQSKRMKLKKWQEPVLRRRLIVSAHRLADLAATVLEAAPALAPGGGYRETAEFAAACMLDWMKKPFLLWPFDDEPPSGWSSPYY